MAASSPSRKPVSIAWRVPSRVLSGARRRVTTGLSQLPTTRSAPARTDVSAGSISGASRLATAEMSPRNTSRTLRFGGVDISRAAGAANPVASPPSDGLRK